MKKHFVTAIAFLATTAAFAQTKDTVATTIVKPAASPVQAKAATSGKPKKDWSKIILDRRANDHFMFQLGYDNWGSKPDSIHISGFNRSANFYFMFDFPFKTDPRFSIGAGLGIGSSNIFFKNQEVMVAAMNSPTLAFPVTEGGNHYKKYKLVTTSLEVPVELRFALDPENTNKSWKFAVGAKLGLLMNAHTKGKTYQNSAGQTIGNYTQKWSSKQYFNSTKLAATARISYGVFGVFGQFQINSLIKNSAGPPVYPFSFGIMLSGL
jgi:hypothetical protein